MLCVSCNEVEVFPAAGIEMCETCAWLEEMDEQPGSRIGKLRRIVDEKQFAKVDGYPVDLFTASMLVKVYEALSPRNRRRFGDVPLPRLVELGWRSTR